MTLIKLKDCYNSNGRYVGKISIDTDDLTPEFIEALRQDEKDELGWRRYPHFEDKMRDAGYDVSSAEVI